MRNAKTDALRFSLRWFKNKAQLLNRYRRVDAHSISISDADFEIFRGIASWFENILSEE